ncbi:hypothetical protein Micbo1qcDRAFT_212857 [Microdochium bolleyi]|uniref:Uncharacterized protein n=1 Tax=Microdochium bolleyi TaxID=196109 RepID=A0A136IX20_9PEZI|nr:hypothetical protein Micbo1qcDRAFT_212857 [Microdochium bolleyi]
MCFDLKKTRRSRERSCGGSSPPPRAHSQTRNSSYPDETISTVDSTYRPPPRLADRRILERASRPRRSSLPGHVTARDSLDIGSVRDNSARQSPTFYHHDDSDLNAPRSREASLHVATPRPEEQQSRASSSDHKNKGNGTDNDSHGPPMTPPRSRGNCGPTVRMLKASVNSRYLPGNHPFTQPAQASNVTFSENVEIINSSSNSSPPSGRISKTSGPRGPRPYPGSILRNTSNYEPYRPVASIEEEDTDKSQLSVQRQRIVQRLADQGFYHPSYDAYTTGSNKTSSSPVPPSPSSSSIYSTDTVTLVDDSAATHTDARGSSGFQGPAASSTAGCAAGSANTFTATPACGHADIAFRDAAASAAFLAEVEAHRDYPTPPTTGDMPSWIPRDVSPIRSSSSSSSSSPSLPSSPPELPTALYPPPPPAPATPSPTPSTRRANANHHQRDFSYSTTPPRMTAATPTSANTPARSSGYGAVVAPNRTSPGGQTSYIQAGEWFGNRTGGLATPIRGRNAAVAAATRSSGSPSGSGGIHRHPDAQLDEDEHHDEFYGDGDGVGKSKKGRGE